MKSLVVISAVAAAALAQSSTSSSNGFIPSDIISGCSSFLQSLDSDASLSSCTSSLLAATSQFGPGASTTPSSSSISSTLDSICSTSDSTCSQQTISGKLSDFYAACSAELTSSPNSDVIRNYDVFYAMTPFKQAACTKADSGKYCAMQESTSSSSASAPGVSDSTTNIEVGDDDVSTLRQWLWTQYSISKRATTQTAAIIPNTTTYRDSNLLFLFLTPQTPSSQLCTTCTRNVLMSYINFETNVPYAPGLSNSPFMGGQPALYNAVLNTCGKDFFSGAVQAAGGISSGILGNSNAAPRSIGQGSASVTGVLMGAVALMVAAIL